jgi:DNA-binding NtrC family response regulator
MKLRILVVDDEKLSRVTTTRQLVDAGYVAEGHETPFKALDALKSGVWDVVLTDLRMPSMDGIVFLKEIRKVSTGTSVILMTAYGTVKTAVEAMRSGAVDYLTKPFVFDELRFRLERLAEERLMRQEVEALRRVLGPSVAYGGLVGHSAGMRNVFEQIEQFAENPSNVLIVGETGTGKELVARALHSLSSRATEPFVPVACAAIPRELAESELFGHEAGAFTGAVRMHRGRVELAREGVLFLDDVDDFPLELQPKLLRVIQEKEFERVGGEKTLRAHMRIISATKSDLSDLIKQGKFREDLYYRLAVLVVSLPPLRQRREDIPLLAQHFLATLARERQVEAKTLPDETLARLLNYAWPGNVRELKHALERAMAVCRGPVILPEHLSATIQQARTTEPYELNLEVLDKVSFRELSERFERDLIQWALQRAGGNQGKAAELLGIPRTTLQSKLGITRRSDSARLDAEPLAT